MGSGAYQSTKKIETCHPGPTFVVFRVPKLVEKTVLNEVCGTFTATKPFSHRGRVVTRKEWDLVREKKSKKEA